MSQESSKRLRAREMGIVLGTMSPGPGNAITDVAGVRVGHATIVRGTGPLVQGVGPVRTGVTAILPHEGDLFAARVPTAAEVFNGFGKTIGLVQVTELGELETPILLTNTLNVGRVADALVGYMIERHPTGSVNPVVCECNDSYLNDIGGRHVGEKEVREALSAATGTPVAEGNIGAGTGMVAYGFAGGIGTASRRLVPERGGYTLGVLVLANFGKRKDLTIAGIPVGRELEQQSSGVSEPERGSIIVVLATDAPLDARQLHRLARRVPLGLARTGTHGGHGSGDLALAFSTANPISHEANPLLRTIQLLNEQSATLDDLFAAVVEATEEAVINALCAARPMTGRDGHQVIALPLEETKAILQRHNVGS